MSELKQYLPNIITLSRPVLACVFLALLPGRFAGSIGAAAPLIVFACICLTDFVDGRLARALGAVSEIGAYLDLYSDFFYIAASLVVLNVLGQMPVWFTAAVFVKFLEYTVTSRILRRGRKDPIFITDPFGRIAAGLFFVIPGAVCILHEMPGRGILFGGFVYLTAALALLSMAVRSISCVRIALRYTET